MRAAHLLPSFVLALAVATACGGSEDAGHEYDESVDELSTRVNLNTATAAQLAAVPGLDAALGARIVATRAERAFFAITDVRRVEGVTTDRYDRARSRLTVGPGCGGRSNKGCATGTRCVRKTSRSDATGVCVAPATTPPPTPPQPETPKVRLLEQGLHSVYAHDPTARRAHRLVYGYTNATSTDFVRAWDRSRLPWYRDVARGETGHHEVELEYVTPAPAGYYTQVNRAVDVPALGKGVLYRVIFRCRESNADRDCGESDVTYVPVVETVRTQWAGQWGLRGYSQQGRGNPAGDELTITSSYHYPLTLTVEAWAPGLTDSAYAEVGFRAELETDLDLSPTYAGEHPKPGGAIRRYPLGFDSRAGNNWRFGRVLPIAFHRNEWGQAYRYRVRFSTDGGRTWQTAGRGEGFSDSWRTLRVQSPCADGGNGC